MRDGVRCTLHVELADLRCCTADVSTVRRSESQATSTQREVPQPSASQSLEAMTAGDEWEVARASRNASRRAKRKVSRFIVHVLSWPLQKPELHRWGARLGGSWTGAALTSAAALFWGHRKEVCALPTAFAGSYRHSSARPIKRAQMGRPSTTPQTLLRSSALWTLHQMRSTKSVKPAANHTQTVKFARLRLRLRSTRHSHKALLTVPQLRTPTMTTRARRTAVQRSRVLTRSPTRGRRTSCSSRPTLPCRWAAPLCRARCS